MSIPRLPGRVFYIIGILAFITINCNDSGVCTLPDPMVMPEVRFTDSNYSSADIYQRVPSQDIFNKFNESYSGKYSDALKAELVEYITHRASELGLHQDNCLECLRETGLLEEGVIALPYLAERAQYESVDAWIFEFTWGHSNELGHFRCYVMDTENHEMLFYMSCR